MEDEDVSTVRAGEEVIDRYEVPTVEDLDSTYGPTVTAAVAPSNGPVAAPRNL
jgi:hypothetical protein